MHDHVHPDHSSGAALAWALVLTLGFAGVEALGGWWAGSLALLGDAGHMVSDAAALGVAALAAMVARRPPSDRLSYGAGRAESVAALANGVFMLGVVVAIVVAAVERLQTPRAVHGSTVLVVAVVGLLINLAVIFVLSRGEQTINTRGALLHVMGDLLGSVSAIIAGAVIHFTGWTPIDPILSILICALILRSSLSLMREVLQVLMEGVPHDLDLGEVAAAMAEADGVPSVHDLHIWTLSSGSIALSAHVLVHDLSVWPEILYRERDLLRDRFGIDHITLQPEPATRTPWPTSGGSPAAAGNPGDIHRGHGCTQLKRT